MIRTGLARLMLALSALAVAGCGSKGPLYLPENAPKRAARPSPIPAPPAPAPRETVPREAVPSKPAAGGTAMPATGAGPDPSGPADPSQRGKD